MRFSLATVATLALCCATHAFVPRPSVHASSALKLSSSLAVETQPIAGMKPGTSGLRKKVEVWKETEHYVENFIQSLLDTAAAKKGGSMPET